jgi:hypothetical protein
MWVRKNGAVLHEHVSSSFPTTSVYLLATKQPIAGRHFGVTYSGYLLSGCDLGFVVRKGGGWEGMDREGNIVLHYSLSWLLVGASSLDSDVVLTSSLKYN